MKKIANEEESLWQFLLANSMYMSPIEMHMPTLAQSLARIDRITCNILVERDSKLLFNARTKNRVYIERNAVIAFAFAFLKKPNPCERCTLHRIPVAAAAAAYDARN